MIINSKLGKKLKYSFMYLVIFLGLIGLMGNGWQTFTLPFLAFIVVPILDHLIPADISNSSLEEDSSLASDPFFDFVLYLLVLIQYFLVGVFLFKVTYTNPTTLELVGSTISMGIYCGVLGINIGHELGHRSRKFDQFLAKTLLLSSLYMHFFVEHNRGHHKWVATPRDPATARRNESVYFFWLRSFFSQIASAWKLEKLRLQKKGISSISLNNQMIQFLIIQVSLCILLGFFFGPWTLLLFLIAALLGILLLETVNYLEHYGLLRRMNEKGQYEKVKPHHSWNSDHVFSRITLFELSRHSDHHYKASRKYQILRNHPHCPTLPYGYSSMVILALIPPLFIKIMNQELEEFQKHFKTIE